MAATGKICIFCGNRPESKSKEHVIPLWLQEHVGIAEETVRMGFVHATGAPRQFVYKSFTFPACKKCNTEFSALEAAVKPILLRMLAEEAVSSSELHCLLDWFDKVRIGLWLGFNYLDKNPGEIPPKFQIKSRMGAHDRVLHIVRVENNPRELSFRGCDSLSFHFTPSCFSMIINNLCFYNISSPFFLARRLGFPFATDRYLRDDGLEDCTLAPGMMRILRPILRVPFAFRGVGIYQPIYRSVVATPFVAYYNNAYVKSNSNSLNEGIGKIFVQDEENWVSVYPSELSRSWLPASAYDRASMNPKISIDTLECQLRVDEQMASTSRLSEEQRNWWKGALSETRKHARFFIRIMKENARKAMK